MMTRTLLVAVLAAVSCQGEVLPRQVLPQDLENQARYQLYLAYAAYCKADNLTNWNCLYCKDVNPAVKVYGVIDTKEDKYDGQVYVMRNNASMIIVSFRGSKNIENWIEDFTFEKVKLKWDGVPSGIEVHKGFHQSYASLQPYVKKWVAEARQDCPNCTFHITGHSLGAAEANLCTLDYRLQGEDPKLWSFGSPRVGNKKYAEFFDGLTTPTNPVYRMVNKKDIVPHLPLHDQFFHHTAREVWRMPNGTYIMCDNTGEDKDCSRHLDLVFCSAKDHTEYMGIDEMC